MYSICGYTNLIAPLKDRNVRHFETSVCDVEESVTVGKVHWHKPGCQRTGLNRPTHFCNSLQNTINLKHYKDVRILYITV